MHNYIYIATLFHWLNVYHVHFNYQLNLNKGLVLSAHWMCELIKMREQLYVANYGQINL